jgi:hypothetical protein
MDDGQSTRGGDFFMSTGQEVGKQDCARHEREIARLNGEIQELELEVRDLSNQVVNLATKIPGTLTESLVTLSTQMGNVIRDVGELKTLVRADLVARAEFNPVQKIVYGMVGLILVTVVGALLALVIQGRIR